MLNIRSGTFSREGSASLCVSRVSSSIRSLARPSLSSDSNLLPVFSARPCSHSVLLVPSSGGAAGDPPQDWHPWPGVNLPASCKAPWWRGP